MGEGFTKLEGKGRKEKQGGRNHTEGREREALHWDMAPATCLGGLSVVQPTMPTLLPLLSCLFPKACEKEGKESMLS